MANSELRRALGQVAQQFIDGVLKAIQSVPLSEVAAEIGGSDYVRGSALGARGGAGRGRRGSSGRAGEANGGAEAGARGGRRRRLVRRAGSEIEGLRASILGVLRASSGPVGASEIARQIGGGVKTADLAFPMAQLRKSNLVHKEGERTQTVYTLTERGKNADGSSAGRRGGRGGARAAAAKGGKAGGRGGRKKKK